MRGKTLWPPAPSTNECFQSLNTCGDPMANESAAGAAVSGSAPQTLISGFKRLDGAADARDQSPAADAGDDRDRLGRVFQDLQTHGRMTGDEIVIVERMDKGPFHSRKRALLQRLPSDIV